MNPPMYAIAAAILITFSMVRATLWHVALAVGLAIAVFVTLAAVDGAVPVQTVVFVVSGFLTLGVLMMLTNRALSATFNPEALAPIQREVTVLFSDIRGFTAIAEALQPREVLELLDDYFGRMSQIVKGHDGVVGKFLGDGMLAFWGVPDRDPDHAAKAVRAALDMQRALLELNRERVEDGVAEIKIGIGIHTGPVAAGMLGGPEQSEYTVIGDAVNVASRIEGLTKTLGAPLLISETTWASCGDRFAGERLAAEEIRGRKEPVVRFSILGVGKAAC